MTVRRFRKDYMYLLELKRKRPQCEDDASVLELPRKKRGQPLLLGEELDQKVKLYMNAMHSKGAVVNRTIVAGVANGVVTSKGSIFWLVMEGILRSQGTCTGPRIFCAEWVCQAVRNHSYKGRF